MVTTDLSTLTLLVQEHMELIDSVDNEANAMAIGSATILARLGIEVSGLWLALNTIWMNSQVLSGLYLPFHKSEHTVLEF